MSTRTPATEGQAKIRQLLTGLRYGHFDSDAIGEINSMLDQALAILDASPPIVGELTEEEIERITLKECPSIAHLPQGDHLLHLHGFQRGLRYARDHGYLAQAPQSSPAPSVIEAGDAIADRLRSLTKGRDWDDTISVLEEWARAKASRPSVTAPQGVTVDQILEVVNDWRANMHLIEVPPNTPYSTGVQNVLRSRLSALLTK